MCVCVCDLHLKNQQAFISIFVMIAVWFDYIAHFFMFLSLCLWWCRSVRFFLCFQTLINFKFAQQYPTIQCTIFIDILFNYLLFIQCQPTHTPTKWRLKKKLSRELFIDLNREQKVKISSAFANLNVYWPVIWQCSSLFSMLYNVSNARLPNPTYSMNSFQCIQFARIVNELKRKWVRNNQHRLEGVHIVGYVLRLFLLLFYYGARENQ